MGTVCERPDAGVERLPREREAQRPGKHLGKQSVRHRRPPGRPAIAFDGNVRHGRTSQSTRPLPPAARAEDPLDDDDVDRARALRAFFASAYSGDAA